MWTLQRDITETLRCDEVMVLVVIIAHLRLIVQSTKRAWEREGGLKMQLRTFLGSLIEGDGSSHATKFIKREV